MVVVWKRAPQPRARSRQNVKRYWCGAAGRGVPWPWGNPTRTLAPCRPVAPRRHAHTTYTPPVVKSQVIIDIIAIDTTPAPAWL